MPNSIAVTSTPKQQNTRGVRKSPLGERGTGGPRNFCRMPLYPRVRSKCCPVCRRWSSWCRSCKMMHARLARLTGFGVIKRRPPPNTVRQVERSRACCSNYYNNAAFLATRRRPWCHLHGALPASATQHAQLVPARDADKIFGPDL